MPNPNYGNHPRSRGKYFDPHYEAMDRLNEPIEGLPCDDELREERNFQELSAEMRQLPPMPMSIPEMMTIVHRFHDEYMEKLKHQQK